MHSRAEDRGFAGTLIDDDGGDRRWTGAGRVPRASLRGGSISSTRSTSRRSARRHGASARRLLAGPRRRTAAAELWTFRPTPARGASTPRKALPRSRPPTAAGNDEGLPDLRLEWSAEEHRSRDGPGARPGDHRPRRGRDGPRPRTPAHGAAGPGPEPPPPARRRCSGWRCWRGARASPLARWFWRLLGAVVSFVAGVLAWRFVDGLLAAYPLLGWVAAVLLGAFGLVCLAIGAARGRRRFPRLARLD